MRTFGKVGIRKMKVGGKERKAANFAFKYMYKARGRRGGSTMTAFLAAPGDAGDVASELLMPTGK